MKVTKKFNLSFSWNKKLAFHHSTARHSTIKFVLTCWVVNPDHFLKIKKTKINKRKRLFLLLHYPKLFQTYKKAQTLDAFAVNTGIGFRGCVDK